MMQTVNCVECNAPKAVRIADIKRNWGRYCSKSCKAKSQEKRTGQFKKIFQDRRYNNEFGGTPHYSRNGEYIGFTAVFDCEGNEI